MPMRSVLPVVAACLTGMALAIPNAPTASAAVSTASAAVSTASAAVTRPSATAPGPLAPAGSTVSARGTVKPAIAYSHLGLPRGGWALVYSDGIAEVHRGNRTEVTHVPLASPDEGGIAAGDSGARDLPPEGTLISDLLSVPAQPFLAGQVVVVYAGTVTAAPVTVSAATLRSRTPAYSSSAALNRLLDRLGVDRARPMFPGAAQRRAFAGLRKAAQVRLGRPLLDFGNAAVLHVTGAPVARAVAELRASPDVAYAEPNWTVSTSSLPPSPVPPAVAAKARLDAARGPEGPAVAAAGVPGNFALASSAQSLLNRPGVDAVPAFADLARYGQLPGQGEIITNVSLGTLDDASAAGRPADACNSFVQALGPTTIVAGGQRYLDWPSMPLIPTYTARGDATLDPAGEACGDDPQLAEVGLDFSMMTPLPHGQQRPGEAGSGLSDLLGIAPGASYRLVVPATPGGAISDVDAAFLAAARQVPRPDVITASLDFGTDQFGFSTRYLEDDPVTESVIASIVSSGIVVTVSAGDGLRTSTNAAVPPSGGAIATNVAASAKDASDLNDVFMSGAPSADLDSGSVDVGGSTLDDIFAAPPGNPANAALAYLHAFPATRFTGGRLYASGFGSRVDVSAPGDNVLSFSHPFGGAADAVAVGVEGGTSASAPETAAAAAVILQVARLTGNRAAGPSPWAVRSFLERTGTPLGPLPEADRPVHAGPQVDVGRAVETLLAQAHQPAAPGVAWVAVEQRQQRSALGGSILTSTDPANIALTAIASHELITIAPDWTGLAPRASQVAYTLAGAGGQVLARTPWARLLPSVILASAGQPLESPSPRSVTLTYTASRGREMLASATFTLTFGPWDGTTPSVAAPLAPAVTSGPEIPVRYNLAGLSATATPTLVVSYPGRIDPATGTFFGVAYSVPLTATSGTVLVPARRLPGAGIYGIGIQASPGGASSVNYSTYAFVRLSPAGPARPAVPALSAPATGAAADGKAHLLEIPYNGNFQLSYDVRGVPGATGAVVEVSAPGPTTFNNDDTFNNPNGSERDANGQDRGSVAYLKLAGTHGAVTLNGAAIGLVPTMFHALRILATGDPRGRHGAVIGEASDVVTITMDGVAASDGGSVTSGFGVDVAGDDGFITSDGGPAANSVQAFSQATATTSTIASSAADSFETTDSACPGIVAGDTGLYADVTSASEAFHLISPVATRSGGGTWDPPAALGGIFCVAANQLSHADAVLSNNGDIDITPADVPAGTFGTPVDVSPALSSLGSPSLGGFAVNPVTGQAVLAVTDAVNPSAPGILLSVSLSSGAITTLPGVPDFATGVAVNPSAGTAGVAMEGAASGLGITDLASGTGTLASPGGQTYEFPATIPGTGDFLVDEVVSPDAIGAHPDNNAESSVIVADAAGDVLHRYEQFNFFNTFLISMGGYLQPNPTTARAFTLGPGGAQLHPFTYAG
jgi:fervidolysin-like protein